VWHQIIRRKAASDTGLITLEPHQGGNGVGDLWRLLMPTLRWWTGLLTVDDPTLPPIHNLGVLLFRGNDIQGNNLFVIGQWIRDSNLRWWRPSQRAETWTAKHFASRAVPRPYPLTRILI
jgi:hypothetical protein